MKSDPNQSVQYSTNKLGFPGGSVSKESTRNMGDLGFIPGLGRSPGVGNGNPFQYSCLENSMDRGAWWAAVHGLAQSRKDCVTNFHFHVINGFKANNKFLIYFLINVFFMCSWRRKWQPTPVLLPGKSHGRGAW